MSTGKIKKQRMVAGVRIRIVRDSQYKMFQNKTVENQLIGDREHVRMNTVVNMSC